MAKIFVAENISKLIDDCLQFHGGAGYIEEGWVARAWRDQRLLRIGGGTSEVMRYYVAKLMGM
jgi:citronellyl-CoA dehydrogenase